MRKQKKGLLVGVILVLYCMILVTFYVQGQFAARYTSFTTGDSTTRIAGIACDVTYTPTEYKDLSLNINASAVYAIVDEFVVSNDGDVTFSYALKLRLSADAEGTATYASPTAYPHGSVAAPALGSGTTLYRIQQSGGSGGVAMPMDFADYCGKSYSAGKIYYGVSTNGTSYTWYNDGVDATGSTGHETVSLPARNLKYGESHYYRVIYFIDLSTPGTTIPLTPAALFYSIECTQVD